VSFNAAHQGKSVRGNHGDSKRASAGGDHRKPPMLAVDEDRSSVRVRSADRVRRATAQPAVSA
jgi:hypothetical protein